MMSESTLTLVVLGVAAFALVILGPITLVKWARQFRRSPYQRAGALLTPAELHFYRTLSRATSEHELVMVKVRIADVVGVTTPYQDKRFWKHFGPIASKHLDFVICDRNTFDVHFAVELDDRSHWEESRVERDRFVNQVLLDAGIPLVRFPVRRHYNAKEVRAAIDAQTLTPESGVAHAR